MASDRAERDHFLHTAIDERLRVARGLLSQAVLRPFSDRVSADSEESLRVFMVRLWPRVARGRATDAEVSEFYETLRELWQPAHTTDLRFLDAWNNAYEAAGDGFPPEFMAAYVELLEQHGRRLDQRQRSGVA